MDGSAGAEASRTYREVMLTLPVPPVPDGTSGMAWFRRAVARFSSGPDHHRRRALVEAELAAIDPDGLRGPDSRPPAQRLAAALGVTVPVTADIAAIAAAYHPHLPITPAAEAGVERLIEVFGGVADERTAARISLLVQAHVATEALLAGHNPPVPSTRRLAPDGRVVDVDLTGTPFGAGPHACPGRAHALALAVVISTTCTTATRR